MEKIRRYGLTKTQIEELSNFCKENIDPIKEKYNKINKEYKQFNVVFGPDKENRKLLREAVVPILWETNVSMPGSSFKDRMISNGYKKPTYVRFFEEDIITYIQSNYNDLYEFFGFRDGIEPFSKVIGDTMFGGLMSKLKNYNMDIQGYNVCLGDKSFNILSLWEVNDYRKFFEQMILDKIPDDILKTSRNLVKVVDDLIKDLNPEKINRVKFIVGKYMENHKFINDEAEATQYINKLFQEVDFFDIDKKEKEEAERLKRKESLNTDIKVINEKLSELKMKVLKLEEEKLNGTISVENFNIHMKNIKDMEVGLNNLLKEKMNYHE